MQIARNDLCTGKLPMVSAKEVPLATPQACEQSAYNDKSFGSSVDSANFLSDLGSQPRSQLRLAPILRPLKGISRALHYLPSTGWRTSQDSIEIVRVLCESSFEHMYHISEPCWSPLPGFVVGYRIQSVRFEILRMIRIKAVLM